MARPLASMLTQSRVNSCFIFTPDLPVNYLLNAKGGCSTILGHLWKALDDVRGSATFSGNPHDDWPWGWVIDFSVREIAHISAKRTFTMVRNPFARALSAYLTKVGKRTEGNLFTWEIFCEHFGLDADARPTFEEYLDLIAREPPEMMDIHWAPQYFNLMQPAARVDDLFYMENSGALTDFLEEWTGLPVERSNHGTHQALDHLARYYSPHAIEMVKQIYARDFELFGYSDDFTVQASVRPVKSLPGNPGGITSLLKHMASDDWEEKLAFLDRFESQSGSDFATALTRFCCGGPEDARMASADRVLHERPENWRLLREMEHLFRAHGDETNAARFGSASRRAHAAIMQAPRPKRAKRTGTRG